VPAFGSISIASLYYLFFFFRKLEFFNPFILFGFFAGTVAVWLILSRVTSTRFFVIALAVFLMTSAMIGFDLLFLHSRARDIATEEVTGYVSRNFEPGSCLNYDSGARDLRKPYIYRYMLYQYPVKRVNLDDSGTFCSEWLISDKRDVPSRFPGAVLVALEKFDTTGLWKLFPVAGGSGD
jgi:hypothetical protein